MKTLKLSIAIAAFLTCGQALAAYSTDLNGDDTYELIDWSKIRQVDAITTTVTHQKVQHDTTGTAAAGFGTGLALWGENSSGTVTHLGGIYCVETDPTGGSVDTYCCVQSTTSSNASDTMCWKQSQTMFYSDAASSVSSHYTLEHDTTATATTGFDVGLDFKAETGSGTSEHAGGLYSTWTDATGGSADSMTCLQSVGSSTAIDSLCADSTGAVTIYNPTRFDYLLSTTQINVSPTAAHTLYTVPAGKTAVVTKLVMRTASASFDQATDPEISFGCNASDYNNISAGATYTTPTSATGVVFPTVAAESSVCAAASVVKANVTTSATSSTTVYVDLFGYLY